MSPRSLDRPILITGASRSGKQDLASGELWRLEETLRSTLERSGHPCGRPAAAVPDLAGRA